MSTMLAFGFMPGEGFALSDCKSFDLAIPHQFIHVLASMAWRTYSYVDYSLTTITLAAEENWPTLIAAASSALRPSHKAPTSTTRPSHKAVSATATPSAPSPAHKILISTPQFFHKTVSTATALSVPWLSRKAATSTPRFFTRSSLSSLHHRCLGLLTSHEIVSTAAALLAPRPSSKVATVVVASMLSLYRLILITAPLILKVDAVGVAVKRGDLPPGWCYPLCRHNTYHRLVVGYWVQVRTPNKFELLIKLSKA
ncbi:hypothetical protein ACLOJK_015315 [Asimina triloba]